MHETDAKRQLVVIIVLAIMPASFISGFGFVLYRIITVMLRNYDAGAAIVIAVVASAVYMHISKSLVMTWYSATKLILRDGRIKK